MHLIAASTVPRSGFEALISEFANASDNRGRGRRRRSGHRLVRRRGRRQVPPTVSRSYRLLPIALRAQHPFAPMTTSPSSPTSCSGADAGPAARAFHAVDAFFELGTAAPFRAARLAVVLGLGASRILRVRRFGWSPSPPSTSNMRIPSPIVYVTAALGVPLLVIASAGTHHWSALASAAIGGAAAFAAFFALFYAVPKGIGFGDVRFAGLCGGFLGWIGYREVLAGFLVSFILAGVPAALLLAMRKVQRRTKIPFGPFLGAGTVITVHSPRPSFTPGQAFDGCGELPPGSRTDQAALLQGDAQVVRVRGRLRGGTQVDRALLEQGDERLVEGLHPVVLALADDRGDVAALAGLDDALLDAPVDDHDLEGRHPARAISGWDQPLAERALQRSGQTEARLALLSRREEVDDPVDRLHTVNRVQRGEDQVAGLGCAQGGLDGLDVAHLADKNHVRVLSQGRAKCHEEAGGVEAHFALADS